VPLAFLLAIAAQATGQPQPPRILQIHREPLRPGSEAAYGEIETDTVRLCAKLGGPHPYLGLEALTGPKEVWFFNGYATADEKQQVADAYTRNAPLMAALGKNSKRKATLTGTPINVFANCRPDLTRGVPWLLGQGRFLVIAVSREPSRMDGTVFEAEDGTLFVVRPAATRVEADAKAAVAGPDAIVFAVRPEWSVPSKEWVAFDPQFWGR
jgi:hypothetical protein